MIESRAKKETDLGLFIFILFICLALPGLCCCAWVFSDVVCRFLIAMPLLVQHGL